MGTSLDKDKEWNVINSPKIKLKVDEKEPQFKATEPVKIKITAECHNVAIPQNGLEYEWVYVDSAGSMKFITTKKGMVMLYCPNFFCGRVMTVKVKVKIKSAESAESAESDESDEKMKFVSFDSGKFKFETLEDTIELRPQCDQELSDNADWLPDEAEMLNYVRSSVEVHGYNGKELVLVRLIKDKEKVIWKAEDKVIVQDNVVSALFSRNLCISHTVNDNTYTLQFQLINPRSRSLLKNYSRDYIMRGRMRVKALTGFPAQPVVVGDISIEDNNFMLCKYTQIDVEYTKDRFGEKKQKVTVFREGGQAKNTVNLIGGKRTITVTLLEYTPEKCKLKENSHKKKEVPLMLYGESEQKLPIAVSGETGKIDNIEVTYDYGLINIMKTLWLPMSGIVQTSKLCTSNTSCRHFNDVVFNMYPDAKWEVFVELGSTEPRLYTHTNMPAEYSIFKRHQEKALKVAKKDDDVGLSFGLSATVDDGLTVIKLTDDIEQSVKTVFEVLKTIRDALDRLSFKKVVDENKDNLKARNILPKSPKAPVFIEISSPVLKIGGGWQYDLNSENQLIRKGEIAVAASPFIKAKGGIDLIACSTYILAVGTIIKGILKINDFAEWATKRLSNDKAKYEGLIWFNLYLEGSLSIMGTYEFSEGDKTIEVESPVNIKFVVELGLSAEVKVETVTISGKESTTVRAGASGEASTGVTFQPKIGYSTEEGMFLGFKVGFDGIILKVNGEAKFEKTKDDIGTFSFGPEFSDDFPLIEPEPEIFEGEVYPFRNTDNK